MRQNLSPCIARQQKVQVIVLFKLVAVLGAKGESMKVYTYAELKKRHRLERDAYAQPVALRVHRALSWLDCSERSTGLDEKFVFLWISFNSAYAAELGSDAEYETARFSKFLRRVVRRDRKARMATILWKRYPGPVRVLLDNQYAFKPFWDFQNGLVSDAQWKLKFKKEKSAANRALASQKTYTVLQLLFHRLYVIRNQLIHGGATWGGKVNRSQIQDGTALLGEIVPLVIEVMMDNALEDWGVPIYPVISADTSTKFSEVAG